MHRPPDDYFLAYFDRRVLCRYRASPDIYVLREDDFGGSLEVDAHPLLAEPHTPQRFRVEFGFRRLQDRRVCVAALKMDLGRLAEPEQLAWGADLIDRPTFLEHDEPFESWRACNLDGEWAGRPGPLTRVRAAVQRCRAVTNQGLGVSLFRSDDDPLLAYPVAENTRALTDALMELYRFVGDDMEGDALIRMAKHRSISLSDPSKRLNTLKEILPADLTASVHLPLRNLATARNKVHKSADARPEPCPAFDSFGLTLEDVANALEQLTDWFAKELGLDTERCLEREHLMNAAILPSIQFPPEPSFKTDTVKSAVGKTIERIEYGGVRPSLECHEWELMVLHFTDGSALRLDVRCNAGNLESQFPGLKAAMFRTSIDPTSIPSPRADVSTDRP